MSADIVRIGPLSEDERRAVGEAHLAALRAVLAGCRPPGLQPPTPVVVPLLREPDDSETGE